MSRQLSIAPKERINIVYKPATGDAQEEIELPLKLLVMSDFTLQEDNTPVEERKIVSVNKSNLNDVMRASNINIDFTIRDTLADNDSDIPVHLQLSEFKDFEPENLVRQVPELRKLLELREALTTLKGPMGNVPAFRKLLQSIMSDKLARDNLLNELQVLERQESSGSDEGEK